MSLPGTLEQVFTIEEDRQGNIWFGDRDAGIWKYDGENMLNYTRRMNLPMFWRSHYLKIIMGNCGLGWEMATYIILKDRLLKNNFKIKYEGRTMYMKS